MVRLPVFRGLFGGGKSSGYTTGDIRSISVSCGHMDYSCSYSFYLRKTETGWLLDADYAAGTGQPHTEYGMRPVAEEDAAGLLLIVQEQQVIETLRRYKKPRFKLPARKLLVMDETVCVTSILFADGKQMAAPVRIGEALESGFYCLAGKYAPAVTGTDDIESSDTEGSF